MLHLVLGGAGCGKTTYIRELLCGMTGSGKKLILIVPDQFSFATEKAVLNKAGPQKSAEINIWSFNRLADEVFREFGGIKEKRLDETGKAILMSIAIKSCRDNLKVYGKAAEKLTGLMVETVGELKSCLITPEDLLETSRRAKGGLKGKAYDIGLIYSAYEALTAQYIDPEDLLTRAGRLIRERGFFKDAIIAFDGFESFNKQKMAVISSALTQGDQCWVALCADSRHGGGAGILEPVNQTAASISALAAELGVKSANPVVLKEGRRFQSRELFYVQQNLFAPSSVPIDGKPENIRIFEGKTVYDEAEYAAATIRNMVMDKGYRYGDFAVICRGPQKYYSAVSGAFEKWQVPCYFSEPRRLDGQPLIRLVMSAFDIVRKGYRTDDVLTMLKSGLCPLDSKELSLLENYVFTWKISGSAWRSPFIKHPKGFGYEMDAESKQVLQEINGIRERIIFPLTAFASSEKTGTGISEAVYRLITCYGVDKTTARLAAEYKEMGRDELAADSLRVWQLLMDVLDKFVNIIGGSPMGIEEYYGYLRQVVAGEEMRDIPMRLDTVIFGTADIIKLENTRAVFVIGAVQGEFPMVPSGSGIFSDSERKTLMDLNLPIEDRLEEQTMIERFYAYNAMSAASEKLFLTYHVTHGSDDLMPSELVERLKALYPETETIRGLPEDYYLSTYGAAFSAAAAHFRDNTELSSTLKAIFADNPDYSGKFEALKRTAVQAAFRLENRGLSHELLGRSYLSASQIESYHRCPFQYFCKYGLNAKERKPAEINVLEYGTLMHYIFEEVFTGDYKKYYGREEELARDVDRIVHRYADEKMGGIASMPGRDKYRFKRMADTAVMLITHMMEELELSSFTPEYFELSLTENSGFPPLKILTESGEAVNVGGVIDRVDIYDAPGGRYVRIIDYKTGSKEFKLADVLYGLNLQMLIYLAAITQGGAMLPAGVLYMPSFTPGVSPKTRLAPEAVKAERDKGLKMNGAVLNDPQIIEAMEKGAAGRFIPVGIKENGKYTGAESAYSPADLQEVFAYVRSLVATMADSLMNGEISAVPLLVNNNSCSWCPFGSVCRSQRDDRLVEKVKLSRDEALNLMRN